MISEIKQIIDGWKNLVFKNPVSEEIGKRRAAICLACKPFYNPDNGRCRICHCYIPAAVRAKDKRCPKGKW